MAFFNVLKNGIKMADLFYSTEMLRYDKEMEYKTFTGGILSIGMIVAVMIGFANMIINTLSLSTITYTQVISKDKSLSYSELNTNNGSKFMMAVQIWQVDMLGPIRYFDLHMLQMRSTEGQRIQHSSFVMMESCTKQHWAGFPQIVAQYESLQMGKWFCLPLNNIFYLSGDYGSNIYQYVNISLNPCNNSLDPRRPCASSSQLQQLFIDFQDTIKFKIYYTNPLINAAQKKYISYYLESSNYINFGQTIGGEGYLYASDYSIMTDNSILPYSNMQNSKGIVIQDKLIMHPYTTFYGTYVSYFIVKSPTRYSYQRTVQKISSVFSFIGGLISAISAALFILKIYNYFAFEISVAICIFKPPEDCNVDPSSITMSFFTFIKFNLFRLMKKIGKAPDWPETSFLIESQRQIIKQLDIKALIKRIIFMEYCMSNLFQDYQLIGLQIQKPRTPYDICKIRQMFESGDSYQNNISPSSDKNSQENSNQSNISIFNRNTTLKSRKMTQILSPTCMRDRVTPLQEPKNRFKLKAIKNINQISNVSEQIKERQNPYPQISEKKDITEKQVNVSKNLLILKKNAEEGDKLSKKIWNLIQSNPNKFTKLRRRIGKFL